MDRVKILIDDYVNRLNSAKNISCQAVILVLSSFFAEIKTMENVENDVLIYLQENISSNLWTNEQLWLGLALEHPSKAFLPYFFSALIALNKNIPYWRILDTLVWTPDDYHLEVTKGVREAISFDNPCWTMEDLKKAFEVLIWIGKEDDINFIKKISHFQNERLCDMAQYWIEWLEDDE